MPGIIKDNPLGNFSRGFLYPFQAAGFINRHPRLFRYIIIPFLVNAVIFCLAVYLGLSFFENIVIHRIPQGEAWYWLFLSYFLWLVALLLTAVLTFFTFAVIGNLIASPFNEILSERTENMLTGGGKDEPFSFRLFLQDARRTIFEESKKIMVFIAGMLLLLLLNFIPGIGSLLYPPLSFLWTVFFLVVEYTGYVFSRHHMTYKNQRRFISGRKFMMLGFGTGVLCILAIPFLQFLCIPLGVVGATMLCYDLRGSISSEI